MVNDGASIIDVGGQSTRPGAEPVSIRDEQQRLRDVITGFKSRFDVALSVDTQSSEIAQWACENGADMNNDVWNDD